MELRFPHWQGQRPGKATVGEEARSDCSGLITACPRSWWAFLCLQCGLPDFSCLSGRREQGSAVCTAVPSSFHCSGESKFAVISVPVIKLNVNLCWSSWKESWKEQLPEQAGLEWEWEYIMVDLLVYMPLFSKWILQQLVQRAGI